MPMRTVPVVVLGVAWLATGCAATATTNNTSTDAASASFTVAEAVAKANSVLGTVFPSQPGTIRCQVGAGGPAPGRVVPVTLQTQVRKRGPNTYWVTFRERWSAKDFDSNGNASESMLQHYWTFKVTPDDSTLLSQGGDLPPQAAK